MTWIHFLLVVVCLLTARLFLVMTLAVIVCDSYTHVGLNGPGILVTNNGYVQTTSSYAFFNKYHLKCKNGGQANGCIYY